MGSPPSNRNRLSGSSLDMPDNPRMSTLVDLAKTMSDTERRFRLDGGTVVLATRLVDLEITGFDEFYQRRVLDRLGIDLTGLAGPQEELLATR